MAYEVTMGKMAVPEVTTGETQASKMTIQKARSKLARMNLVDQFLFDEVMEYQDAFQAAISILMSKEIVILGRAETEKEFRISPELRQARLDSVAMDKNHVVYMMEMQKRNTKNLSKRSRFYQGHVDVSLMVPGTVNFNSLKDVCQILVTPFDVFGRGLYRYTFKGVCVECPDLEIGDGAWRVFINTKGKNAHEFTQEFLDFMEYITKSTDTQARKSESEKIKTIHKRVKEVKKSEKTGVKLMWKWEEMALERAEARAAGMREGKREGRREGKIEGIKEGRILEIYSLVQDGDLSLESAAKRLGITPLTLKNRLSAFGYQYPET